MVLLLIPLLAVSCISVNAPPEDDSDEKKTDGAFIHISKGADDAHNVLMALMLADLYATGEDPGYDVLVFFDKQGIEMVTKDAPNLEMEPFDPSDEIFARLVENGATIMACPACMKVAGVEESDLREGVRIADKKKFFNFTEGRILSLDY